MSVTFTKLFSSITESTVWCEPMATRLVWITMLAMADKKGRVWGSVPGLANRARVPIEDTEKALETFQAPDRYSRTTEHEGRRIAPMDGGWQLLNYQKYRDIRDEEDRLQYKREWDRNNRSSKSDKIRQNPTGADPERHSAEAEAEAVQKVNTVGATPSGAAPVFLEIPLAAKGQTHAVTEAKVAEWQESYPGIDVRQSLRTIRQWNIDNPANRKTARGIEAHISRWLAKDQNSARPGQAPAAVKTPVSLLCESRNARNEACGMPAKERGGRIMECDGCYHKRMERKPMPAEVRERLGLQT